MVHDCLFIYIAAGRHIWRSFPYPPPRDAAGSLEYTFNSTSGQKFQFLVPVFQINEQLLELYANSAPSLSSCDLRVLRHNLLEIALQPIPGYSFLTYC